MIKVKTSELSGKALDYAVALAGDIVGEWYCTRHGKVEHARNWNPSANWAQGGPIIEREGIDLYCNLPTNPQHIDQAWRGSWRARYCRCGTITDMVHGSTALIAAMRCYVASKLGNEIEIPSTLTD